MPDVKFTKLSIAVVTSSFDVAFKLGFGVFENQTDVHGRALLISVLLLGDDVEPHETAIDESGKEIVLTNQRSAFGVRFAVKMTTAQASSRISFGSLAATNDTSISKVQLDKMGKGLPPELVAMMADIEGELTASSLGGIREVISKQLPAYILGVAKVNGQLGTNPIYEQAAPLAAQTDYEPYKAINYGTLKVAQGIRREAALRPAWLNEMDRAVVSGVYARYGVTDADPTVEQAKQAADWIKTAEKRKPS